MKKMLYIAILLLATLPASALNIVDQAYLGKIGKNWIKNSGAEQGRAGWSTFADAAATTPVDCTGGSPASTWTVTGTNPLAEAFSFLWTHSANNRQGEGVSYDFTIDRSEMGKQQQISLDYEVASGTFVAGVNPIGGATAVDSDLEAFLYDKTNTALIDLTNKRFLSNTKGKFTATFQSASNSQSYRFCLFNPTTTTTAHTVEVDSIKISPVLAAYAPSVSDWQTYTPTITNGTKGTVTTDVGYWRRVGDTVEIHYDYKQSAAGSNGSGTYLFSLPAGVTIDLTKVTSGGGNSYASTVGTFTGTASTSKIGVVGVNDSTHLNVSVDGGTGILGSSLTGLSLGTSGSLFYSLSATVPVVGMSSGNPSAQSGDDARMVGFEAGTATATISGTASDVSWTKVRDDLGGFNGTTTWTVPSPGWYEIDAAMRVDATYAAGNDSEVILNINGSDVHQGLDRASGAQVSMQPHIHKSVFLKGGDTVKIRVSSAGSTPATSSEAAFSWWTITKWPSSAYLTAADTVAARYTSTSTASQSSSDAIINYDTKVYDTTGIVTTGASWKATAPIPGRYRINAHAETSNTGCTSTNSHLTLSVYKNGSREQVIDDRVCNITGGYRKSLNGAVDVTLNAGDYVDVRMSVNDATTHSLASYSTDAITSVEVLRVGN